MMSDELKVRCLSFITHHSAFIISPSVRCWTKLSLGGTIPPVTSGRQVRLSFFFPVFFRRSASRTWFPTPADFTSLLEPGVEDGRQLTYSRAAGRPQTIGRRTE